MQAFGQLNFDCGDVVFGYFCNFVRVDFILYLPLVPTVILRSHQPLPRGRFCIQRQPDGGAQPMEKQLVLSHPVSKNCASEAEQRHAVEQRSHQT